MEQQFNPTHRLIATPYVPRTIPAYAVPPPLPAQPQMVTLRVGFELQAPVGSTTAFLMGLGVLAFLFVAALAVSQGASSGY